MASGKMTRDEFAAFLSAAFANLATHSCDGAIHYVCMDWRHMGEVLEAGAAHYSELKNLIIWVQRRHGRLLPLKARTHLRLQEGGRPARQQLRARQARTVSHQRLAVSGRQHLEGRPAR
jgi:hypothetical protein